MHRRSVTAAVVGAVLLAAAAGGVASAHIVKQFGPYSIALGWLVEPTYVGERNAVVVIVKDATGNPVDDIKAGDLTVSVTAAGQSTAPLPLIPSFDPDTGLGTHASTPPPSSRRSPATTRSISRAASTARLWTRPPCHQARRSTRSRTRRRCSSP